ncbi:MAG TPA: LacI family transcriptional regulator [Epulopiscium sp.]|nr:LacI family transcriptional regulator [Candidatus Epulonipiscium sp.]
MVPSIKDVALKAGVSTATVSHVINKTRYVAEDTKLKVTNAMKDLDYRPNYVARSLRSQKSKTVGLLVPVLENDTSNSFFMSVAQGIQSVLKEDGYNLILCNSNESVEDEQEQIRILNAQQVDGMIIAPTAKDHSYLKELLHPEFPLVFIDRRPEGYEGDCVLANGYQGTYEAVESLIKKGHKNIGFVTGALDVSSTIQRLEGYKQVFLDYKLEINPKLIREGISKFESGYQLAQELADQESVTAIFVSNNVMTMGVFKFLQEHKYKIPEDVAVIGFDDYEWAKVTTPTLTMIKQPSIELGKKAAEILLSRIQLPGKEYKEYKLLTEIIKRESC